MRKIYAVFTKCEKLAFVFFIFLSCFIVTEKAIAQGPGAAWQYVRLITLSTPTTLANYQVKVTLTTAVMGNPYTNVNAAGNDLRFYDNNGNNCPYWIESFNNTGSSIIWIKLVSQVAGPLRMYYGNAAGTAVSDGNSTFDFFDDFLGSGLAANWSQSVTSGNTIGVTAGNVTLTNNTTNNSASAAISSAITPASTSFSLEVKHRETAYNRNRFYAATAQNARSPLAFDYGYFYNGAGAMSTAVVFYSGFSANKLNSNTDYLTRWQITDGSTYNWSTLNYP
ncbi:MAG: DUF2341 domain-containing protein, partial [Chitinophagaceae bacterium]